MVHRSSPLILVSDTLAAMRQRWKTAFVVFGLTLGLVVGYLLTAPLEYESEGKLNVQIGRGMVSADRMDEDDNTVSVVETRESEINSILDILGSRGLLEEVVDEVGVDRITQTECLAQNWLPNLGSSSSKVLTDRELRLERESAIRHLSSNLSVHNPRKASTISVNVKLGSPELAQETVQKIMEKYLASHVDAHQTEGSLEFFEVGLTEKQTEVTTATEAIRDFKNEVGVMNIALAQQAVRTQISKIEQDSVSAVSDLAAGRAKIEELETLIKQTPQDIDAEVTEGFSNEAADRIRDQLFLVEREYQTLLSKYDESHPRVIRKQEELTELRNIHTAQSNARSQTKKIKNPIRNSLELDLMRAEAEAVGLQARVDALARKHKDSMVQLSELNRNEVELSELERSLAVATKNLQRFSDKREEAKINLALDSERISNVKIRQPATYVLKPISPKKGLILAAGGMLAIFGAIGAALFHHHLLVDTARVREAQTSLNDSNALDEQDYPADFGVEPAPVNGHGRRHDDVREPEPEHVGVNRSYEESSHTRTVSSMPR